MLQPLGWPREYGSGRGMPGNEIPLKNHFALIIGIMNIALVCGRHSRGKMKKTYEKDKIYAYLYNQTSIPLRQAYRFVFALGIVAEILLRLVAHP